MCFDGRPDVFVVRKGLSHAHKHDVPEPAGKGVPAGVDHLFHNLADRQLTVESPLACGAKGAAHSAAGLARDAHRGPVRVEHQHGLYPAPIRQCPQPFGCLPARTNGAGDFVEGGDQSGLEPVAERLGQVGHVSRAYASFPQASPDLVPPVPGLVRKQLGQVLPGHFERRRHGPSAYARGYQVVEAVTQYPTTSNSATMVGGQ